MKKLALIVLAMAGSCLAAAKVSAQAGGSTPHGIVYQIGPPSTAFCPFDVVQPGTGAKLASYYCDGGSSLPSGSTSCPLDVVSGSTVVGEITCAGAFVSHAAAFSRAFGMTDEGEIDFGDPATLFEIGFFPGATDGGQWLLLFGGDQDNFGGGLHLESGVQFSANYQHQAANPDILSLNNGAASSPAIAFYYADHSNAYVGVRNSKLSFGSSYQEPDGTFGYTPADEFGTMDPATGNWVFGGSVDVSSHKITSLSSGTVSSDAVNLGQLQGQVAQEAVGGYMPGSVTASTSEILGCFFPNRAWQVNVSNGINQSVYADGTGTTYTLEVIDASNANARVCISGNVNCTGVANTQGSFTCTTGSSGLTTAGHKICLRYNHDSCATAPTLNAYAWGTQ